MFKIEKGIPAPEKASVYKPRPRPPVEEMEIGDSVVIKAKAGMGATNICAIAARRQGLKHKFTSQIVSNGVYRVWRIA